MTRNEAQALANVVCRVLDYYIMAQRTYVTHPISSDESIHNAVKAEQALAEAIEQITHLG